MGGGTQRDRERKGERGGGGRGVGGGTEGGRGGCFCEFHFIFFTGSDFIRFAVGDGAVMSITTWPWEIWTARRRSSSCSSSSSSSSSGRRRRRRRRRRTPTNS